MRYLFIIQGEGRGHLTQALALSDMLRRNGHSISEVLVGRCKNRQIPKFFAEKINAPLTQFDSPTLDYGQSGKRGRIIKTFVSNTTPNKLNRWRKSIATIKEHIERSDADLVVNFYDFLFGAANMIHQFEIPSICIGHQFMADHPKFTHRSQRDGGSLMLRFINLISSYGSVKRLALSFYPLSSSTARRIYVVPPLLRSEIFELESTKGDYILGYMLNPAYLSEVMVWKSQNLETKVHLFWDKQGAAEVEERLPNLWLHKINDELFLNYMAGCSGYVTTAGFESICEALYLGKPTLMIPAHVEQQINAADAHSVGAGEVAEEFNLSLLTNSIESYSANTEEFREWVNSAEKRILKALTDL